MTINKTILRRVAFFTPVIMISALSGCLTKQGKMALGERDIVITGGSIRVSFDKNKYAHSNGVWTTNDQVKINEIIIYDEDSSGAGAIDKYRYTLSEQVHTTATINLTSGPDITIERNNVNKVVSLKTDGDKFDKRGNGPLSRLFSRQFHIKNIKLDFTPISEVKCFINEMPDMSCGKLNFPHTGNKDFDIDFYIDN